MDITDGESRYSTISLKMQQIAMIGSLKLTMRWSIVSEWKFVNPKSILNIKFLHLKKVSQKFSDPKFLFFQISV